MGIIWAYFGNILGVSWSYFGHVLDLTLDLAPYVSATTKVFILVSQEDFLKKQFGIEYRSCGQSLVRETVPFLTSDKGKMTVSALVHKL